MAKRLAGRAGYPKDNPFRVTLHHDKLKEPLGWTKPRMVFVCSMGDLFHRDAIAAGWTDDVFEVMTRPACAKHTFQILTKRPDVALEWLDDNPRFSPPDGWDNLWWGVTVEDQERAWRIKELLQIPAAIRFISLEPLLGPIDLEEAQRDAITGRFIDWCIVGAESGPRRRPCDNRWIADIVEQCIAAGVSVFVKQIQVKGKVVKEIEAISNLLGYAPEQLRQWPTSPAPSSAPAAPAS